MPDSTARAWRARALGGCLPCQPRLSGLPAV